MSRGTIEKMALVCACMLAAGAASALSLTQKAEPTGGGAYKIKVLQGAQTLQPPVTPEAHRYKFTRGSDVREVKWHSVEDVWRERAFVGKWRDKAGNEMTLSHVRCVKPEVVNEILKSGFSNKSQFEGLAELTEINKALDAAESKFGGTAEEMAAWKRCWGGTGPGKFVTLKDVGNFYIEFSFAKPVADKEAQRLLKVAAESLKAQRILKVTEKSLMTKADGSSVWWSEENDQYVFMTDLDRVKGRAFIMSAMKLMTAMRAAYERHVPPTKKIGKCRVRVFATAEGYRDYLVGSDAGESTMQSCGLWSPMREELLILADGKHEPQETMRHEAFHQYLFYATGRGDHAMWFNEGLATFFENVNYNAAKKSVRVLDSGSRAQYVERYAGKVAAAIKDTVAMSRDEYYSGDVGQNYATGWAIMYFLQKGAYATDSLAEYRNVVPAYLKAMSEGASADEATRRAWAPVASRDVAADFADFWKRFRGVARRLER